jgi:putative hydrolase of the HAD superfamily
LEQIVRAARTAFQRPEVPSSLPLVSGVKELLKRLSSKYKLFLVTQGDPIIQKQKIKSLGIESCFIQIFILNSDETSISKKDSFQNIITLENILLDQLLSVGNRLDNEIRIAKKLGAMTCYIKYGEHALAAPRDSFEIADFTTPYITEIERVCEL